jgi:hypothetical protein
MIGILTLMLPIVSGGIFSEIVICSLFFSQDLPAGENQDVSVLYDTG